jgi:L-threonylcarbamoyladenylate synthase
VSPQLEQALALLRAGGLVCVPTESSYGLAVDADSEAAIGRLQNLKGREDTAPFGLIAGSLAQAQACTGAWPRAAEELAQAHWPGALTLILPPTDHTAAKLVGPSGGVGLRVSSCEPVRWLAAELGRPITATSANPSGQAPATTVSMAQSYFGSEVDYYLEGGTCSAQASTLVDFDAEGRPQVLRQGPIVLPAP